MAPLKKTVYLLAISLALITVGALLAPRTSSTRSEIVIAGGQLHDPVRSRAGARPSLGMTARPTASAEAQAAESMAFRTAQSCAFAAQSIATMRRMLDSCSVSPSSVEWSDAHEELCPKVDQQFPSKIATVEKVLAQCPYKVDDFSEQFFRQTQAAATMGDIEAQLCYVQNDFELNRPRTPEENQLFEQDAPAYVENALRRGDWRIIQILFWKRGRHTDEALLPDAITTNDVDSARKYARLMRRGAGSESFRRQMDMEIRASSLTKGELAELDAWAERMYQMYFAKSPLLHETPRACSTPYGTGAID